MSQGQHILRGNAEGVADLVLRFKEVR